MEVVRVIEMQAAS
jgi:signal transduction histidine kinase